VQRGFKRLSEVCLILLGVMVGIPKVHDVHVHEIKDVYAQLNNVSTAIRSKPSVLHSSNSSVI